MTTPASTASRFRRFRERAGLTHGEVAASLPVSAPCIWDIESDEDELSSCYSVSDVQKFCKVLGVRPIELFGGEAAGPPIPAVELVNHVHHHCHSYGITLHQFEDAVGWRLSACMEPAEQFFEGITTDGLQWLCRELGIDWRQVILSL